MFFLERRLPVDLIRTIILYNPLMRKFIFAVLFLLGIYFIIGRFSEVKSIVSTLQKGNWLFIFLAILTEGLWMITVALLFLVTYRVVGIQETFLSLLPIVTAANFASIVAPSAGISGAAVLISEARRRKYSPARAAVGGALFLEFDYIGFLCILALGLIVLVRRKNLTSVEIIASIILIGIAGTLATLLYLGIKSAAALEKVLVRSAGVINRLLHPFLHRDHLSTERAHSFAYDLAGGLRQVSRDPRKLILPVLVAILNKGLLLLILLLVFLAFKVPFSVGTIIASFSIAYLFLIVSPTPAGLGVVEGALTLALASMYIPLEAAAVITLAYRGITFWLPLMVGMFAFRWVSRSLPKETKGEMAAS